MERTQLLSNIISISQTHLYKYIFKYIYIEFVFECSFILYSDYIIEECKRVEGIVVVGMLEKRRRLPQIHIIIIYRSC